MVVVVVVLLDEDDATLIDAVTAARAYTRGLYMTRTSLECAQRTKKKDEEERKHNLEYADEAHEDDDSVSGMNIIIRIFTH